MKFKIKLFFIVVLMITEISSNNLFSQTQAFNSDSIKTVAIYSSKKSFFKDYPVDTLVSHLNLMNNNRNIKYYRNTEDRSKTGFYADYLVDLDVRLITSALSAPKWETVTRTTPAYVSVRQSDGTYLDLLQNITTKEERYIDAAPIPAKGEIQIKIIEKRKNEKVSHQTLKAGNNKEQDLKLVLIIKLIEFMLGRLY